MLQLLGCACQPPAPVKEPVAANACQEEQKEIARLRLLLDEKTAEVERLRRHRTVQARKLADASKEVVRAQSKLLRLASEADAATEQAEAEIALRAVRERFNLTGFQPDLFQAQQLLAVSGEAFRDGNYADSVELAGEAKQFVALAEDRLGTPLRRSMPADDVAFRTAVQLRVRVQSNLRSAPSRASDRVSVLDPGTLVSARAFRGRWVSVQIEDGREGWVFHSLLDAP